MSVTHPAHRGSIALEDGRIRAHERFPGEQFVLRIAAPKCAGATDPKSPALSRTSGSMRRGIR